MELIQICCGHDDITQLWAGAHGPIRNFAIGNNAQRVFDVIWSVFTLAGIANTQS